MADKLPCSIGNMIGRFVTLAQVACEIENRLEEGDVRNAGKTDMLSRVFRITRDERFGKLYPDGDCFQRGYLLAEGVSELGRQFGLYFNPYGNQFVLVEEFGGIAMDWNGEPPQMDGYPFAAWNVELVETKTQLD
jgi:hypothetical protein